MEDRLSQLVARWRESYPTTGLQLPSSNFGEADVQGKGGAPLEIEALL